MYLINTIEKLTLKRAYKILLQQLAWQTTTNAGIYALASFDNFKDWAKDNKFIVKNKLVVSYSRLFIALRGY